jgi:ribosome-associated toxin RatA of RatAB toxin-antitoxin module
MGMRDPRRKRVRVAGRQPAGAKTGECVISIRRSALVLQTPERMFDLVNEVEAYPRRFGWCAAAHVLGRDDSSMTARLDVRVAGFTLGFTTRNQLERPQRIVMNLVDGPFSALVGEWTFAALGEDGCKIAFALDFDYAGRLAAPALRLGFKNLADRMVDDFVREARRADG